MPIDPGAATLGAAAISAGGSIAGGLLGDGAGKAAKGGDYRTAARSTIQGKMMAAEEFGLHPLFALGTSTPGPAQVIPGQSKWGSIAKDVSLQIASAVQELPQARAQTDLLEAQAELARAQAKNLNQGVNAPATSYPLKEGPYKPPKQGVVKHVPAEQISSAKGEPETQAGNHPFFRKYVLRHGKDGTPYYVYLPGSEEPAEALENIGGIILSIGKNTAVGARQLADRISAIYNADRRRVLRLINYIRSQKPTRAGRRGSR